MTHRLYVRKLSTTTEVSENRNHRFVAKRNRKKEGTSVLFFGNEKEKERSDRKIAVK